MWLGKAERLILVVGVAAAAQAQSLTTTFAGGGAAPGIMFEIEALHPAGVTVTGISINFPLAPQNGWVTRSWGRFGTFIGHTESAAGWGYLGGSGSSAGTPPGPPYPVPSSGFNGLHLNQGQTFAFYIETSANQGYTPIPPAQGSHENVDLRLRGGVAKAAGGFTAATTANAMVNCTITYTTQPPRVCYANCDGSTTVPYLNVQDFGCFLGEFAAGSFLANCDGGTVPPFLNIADFGCFLNKFAAGCSTP